MQVERDVAIDVSGGVLHGRLALPESSLGTVVLVHGGGSGRHSPRNQAVAAALQRRGLATLLIDLLTESEDTSDAHSGRYRFDIELLADRVGDALTWLTWQPGTGGHPVGLFGASTGAAAALVVAQQQPHHIAAVVSRGGRPDLAGSRLAAVHAPVLLIVGGDDRVVVDLNRRAHEVLPGEKRLEIIPGATHLFEEPGALAEVARLAGGWFVEHMAAIDQPAAGGHPPR